MFFIFGFRSINKNKGQRNEFCPICNKETIHTIILNERYFNLFFISIFPIGHKKMLSRCNLCGYQSLIAQGTTQTNLNKINQSSDNPIILNGTEERKSWLTTLLLCIFLGCLGIHRFYTKHTGSAIVELLTFGGFGIWYIIDIILILTGNFKDADGNQLAKK